MKSVLLTLVFALVLTACAASTDDTPITPSPMPPVPPPTAPPMVGEPVGPVVDETPAPPEKLGEPETTSGVTRAELAEHNAAKDCWVGYQGTAYDLTAWLLQHPGGSNAIAPYCGTVEEFTNAYTNQHNRPTTAGIERRGDEQGALAE